MYVKIEPNPDGSHAYQIGGTLEDGWAVIPEDMELPPTFPFISISAELVTRPASIVEGPHGEEIVLEPGLTQMEVTAMAEGEEIPLPEEPEPTTLEGRVRTLEKSQNSILETLGAILEKLSGIGTNY